LELELSLIPCLTQSRSFQRRSSQPITWLIPTNKTVQENTRKIQLKKQTTQNTAKQNYRYSASVFSRLLLHSARKRHGH